MPDFRFHVPVTVYAKARPNGRKSKRIGGLVTTPTRDKQGETVSLAGLDFSEFEDAGWFNDNHGTSVTDLVGLPTAAIRKIKKGELLPDGSGDRAPADARWAEGILIGKKGDEIARVASDLQGTGRSLGFSIEGGILERDPMDSSNLARALVRNIAVTHCPVNPETELRLLAKSLSAGGAIDNPGASPGDGFPLRAESLDRKPRYLEFGSPRGRGAKPKPCLDEDEGVEFLRKRHPDLTEDMARQLYRSALRLRDAGVLREAVA